VDARPSFSHLIFTAPFPHGFILSLPPLAKASLPFWALDVALFFSVPFFICHGMCLLGLSLGDPFALFFHTGVIGRFLFQLYSPPSFLSPCFPPPAGPFFLLFRVPFSSCSGCLTLLPPAAPTLFFVWYSLRHTDSFLPDFRQPLPLPLGNPPFQVFPLVSVPLSPFYERSFGVCFFLGPGFDTRNPPQRGSQICHQGTALLHLGLPGLRSPCIGRARFRDLF